MVLKTGQVTYNTAYKIADFYAVEFDITVNTGISRYKSRRVVFCGNIKDFRERIETYGFDRNIIPNSTNVYAIVSVSAHRNRTDVINLLNFFLNSETHRSQVRLFVVKDGEKKFWTHAMRKRFFINNYDSNGI